MPLTIRREQSHDHHAIANITAAAFATMAFSSQTESYIISRLRNAGALTISLIAAEDSEVIGHVAFSAVTIDGKDSGWYGLGPVAVRPDRQRRGIGSALIRQGFHRLRELNASGCVVLGNPDYYGRFGFRHDPALFYAGGPSTHFQHLVWLGTAPQGEVVYHSAFDAA